MKKLIGLLCTAFLILASCGTTSNLGKPETKLEFMERLQKTINEKGIEQGILVASNPPKHLSEDFDIKFLHCALLLSDNQLEPAENLLNNLYDINPENPDLNELKLQLSRLKGDTKEYKKMINDLYKQDKTNPIANIAMGNEAFAKKNYKQAKLYYSVALKNDPNNQDALFGLGEVNYYMEDDESAKKQFNKLIEIDSENASAYLFLGKIAGANNEYKIASDYAKKACSLDSSNYENFLDYGMWERYLGHYDAAEKAWTKAIELEKSYFLPYAYRGGLYDEQNIYNKALADYKKVIELNPNYYYAYESVGILALIENNWTTAREAFMKCYDANKDNISYPLLITYCYYKEGNGNAARDFSNQVLRKMDRNSIEYAMLRIFHDRAGEQPLPQRIASITSRNLRGKMYYYLGLYSDLFGATDLANEYYTKVVNMNDPMFFEYRLAELRVKGKVSIY